MGRFRYLSYALVCALFAAPVAANQKGKPAVSPARKTRSGVKLRPYKASDAKRVVRFFQRAHQADSTMMPVSEGMWNAVIGSNPNISGTMVVERDNEVIGLVTSNLSTDNGQTHRRFRVMVDPAVRNQGHGSALFDALVALDAPDLERRSSIPSAWTRAASFLERRGFKVIHREIRMERRPGMLSPPELPAGMELRDFTPADAQALVEIQNRAYATAFGYTDTDVDEFVRRRGIPGSRNRVLTDNGAIVGFAQTFAEGDGLTLENIFVDRTTRRRGMGKLLMQDALTLTPKSTTTLWVDGDNDAGLALYRRFHFEDVGETLLLSNKAE